MHICGVAGFIESLLSAPDPSITFLGILFHFVAPINCSLCTLLQVVDIDATLYILMVVMNS